MKSGTCTISARDIKEAPKWLSSYETISYLLQQKGAPMVGVTNLRANEYEYTWVREDNYNNGSIEFCWIHNDDMELWQE